MSSAEKRWTLGTERAIGPEASLARAAEAFDTVGITRLANLTGLDSIGVPVYQAVRPNAVTLSVSQGKGINPDLAKVSAVMEAIELWHAENIELRGQRLSVAEAAAKVEYDPYDLPLSLPSWLHDETVLEWLDAVGLITGARSMLPRELIDIGATLDDPFTLPLFRVGTNGLASGNTTDEATLHALFEIIERDSMERHRRDSFEQAPLVSLESVTVDYCVELLKKFEQARISLAVYNVTSLVGLPTFAAVITSPELPSVHLGSGCHAHPGIALSRALTEAAQVRLTVIAGARDDLSPQYRWADLMTESPTLGKGPGQCEFSAVEAVEWSPRFDENVRQVAARIQAVTSAEPVAAELTRQDVGIPVVFVAAPGLSPYRAAD